MCEVWGLVSAQRGWVRQSDHLKLWHALSSDNNNSVFVCLRFFLRYKYLQLPIHRQVNLHRKTHNWLYFFPVILSKFKICWNLGMCFLSCYRNFCEYIKDSWLFAKVKIVNVKCGFVMLGSLTQNFDLWCINLQD